MAKDVVFPTDDIILPNHLAYVEWFTPLPATTDSVNQLYKVSRVIRNGERHASVIPVEMILCSVHLFPRFGTNTPQEWDSSSVLELCQNFYVNPFSNRNIYIRFM